MQVIHVLVAERVQSKSSSLLVFVWDEGLVSGGIFFGVRCAWHKYFGFSTTFTVHPAMLSDGQSTLLHHTVPASRKQPFYRWELNRSDIEMGQGLGEGLFGVVYKALLKGKTTVAVKKFEVRYEYM